jgi:16S rRNA (cytidine1402-2'-O)-methyltransferase
MATGRLFVVATPIGNLQDITLRALEVLAGVDLVAAEDTRRTRVLFERHGLGRKLLSLQEHNEEQQAPKLVQRLLAGESIALVSDAGTPLLSDPGYRLVKLAAEAGVEVVAIPGSSAVTAALSISGLPTDRFVFEGFLPAKRTARLERLAALRGETRTLVLFESSHRILDALADLAEVFGENRSAALCREMTKQFETVLRGPLSEILRRVTDDSDQQKGEFVLVVAGAEQESGQAKTEALVLARALLEHLSPSQAARVAANLYGVSRRDLYRALDSGE